MFYPCANDKISQGVVNDPTVLFDTLGDAYVGMDYPVSFAVDAVFGVAEITATYNEKDVEPVLTEGKYTFTIPTADVTGESLVLAIRGTDTLGVAFEATKTIPVVDAPVISAVTPKAGTQTGEEKRPVISATFINGGENPTITMTVNGKAVTPTVADGIISYTPTADLADGNCAVEVTITRTDNKQISKTWSFIVGRSQYQLYFGQLHSHTDYSDGSGSLTSALDYIGSLPKSANVDFVAFTDHSNYFDNSGVANPEGALYDMSLASDYSQETWSSYTSAIDEFNRRQSDVIALAGFEMTWSSGPGHINTFATNGIVSRNNTTLNSKTNDAGMKAYYALLSQAEGADSISQFNHPGTTFGTFSDFAYYDPLIDSRIYLLEVGNGEGAIGAGGYYPSYEHYTTALDKGWHLGPTNNQDNHKGNWGNANDARDVVLTNDFSQEGIYDAIRNYRIYATEDKNLEIDYTVNGMPMGTIFDESPEALDVNVTLHDPDASDAIAKVELIVNSGRVAHTWNNAADLATGSLTATLAPDYSYYYVKVTQKDGDLAVTAPVWVGESLKLGISSLTCGTSVPVTDEALTLTTTFFNSEAAGATVESLTYTVGDKVVGTDTTGYALPASGTLEVPFSYTPTVARLTTLTVSAEVVQNGLSYTFTKDITLDVLNAKELLYIGIDASHYNEYVSGAYKDGMGNFSQLAADRGLRTVELDTSETLIAACKSEKYKMMILTVPSRRRPEAQTNPGTYSQAELDALAAFSDGGGTVVLAGWSDLYEDFSTITGDDTIKHMAETQNELLAALGSSLRISDDGTNDDVLNGGQPPRLYLSTYNWDNFLMDGVIFDAEHPNDRTYSQVFSQYGGASIHAVDAAGTPVATLPSTVDALVYGHSSTYSKDSDGDGLGGADIPKYAYAKDDNRLLLMATEALPGKGLVVVSGAAFMSNFEVQDTDGTEKRYANYDICENLLDYINPVTITDIADVQAETEEGVKFTIEGVLTSNASGYDQDTAFFDCVYLQDDTAGINAFPVSGSYKIGDKVRITGTTSSYQGERQIAVTSIQVIGSGKVKSTDITAGQLNNGSVLGKLVTLTGTVESYEETNGLVQTIMVKDSKDRLGRVFIDGYITTGDDVENLKVGYDITVTGLASYDNTFNAPDGPFPRIRIRDRADVVCTKPDDDSGNGSGSGSGSDDGGTGGWIPPSSTHPFLDVPVDAWYYDSVQTAYRRGLFQGTSDTLFAPNAEMTRGMLATVLYRMSSRTYTGATTAYTDVPAGQWYTQAVAWADSVGIIKGYGNGLFGPNDTVTREQIALMLQRYSAWINEDTASGATLSGFADSSQVSAFALEAMQWAVGNGLINGRDGNLLAPLASASRAEVVTMLVRYLEI